MERVLKGRPWIFDNQILSLKKWRQGLEVEIDEFNKVRLWVQLWNIPLHWLTRSISLKIGSVLGKMWDANIPNTGGKESRHIKVLVEFDACLLLIRGTMAKMGGANRWIEFRYEKCPDFCYKCGVIGHNEKGCTNILTNVQSNLIKFGSWLKAKKEKRTNSNQDNGQANVKDPTTGVNDKSARMMATSKELSHGTNMGTYPSK
ncbi:hypothetical protein ACH5RR_005803 [Cinchona calisaya]|uniref:CCHC-type domain-containing protein n=1 Tax=Cinchona calisaya TaxID=153742 RepID=A0ABD3AM97_9GENT